jgi:preprotein translocase subunit SecA
MNTFVEKLFGDRNKKTLKQLQKSVDAINALEDSIQPLTDQELQAKTQEFRDRLEKGETLGDLRNEAFAVVREAARRTLGQRHYDVQIIGGLVLDQGNIAEMRTGEGKTLSATTAAYLNALGGKGTHIITVNDYLSRRDADWMGQVYHFLGLTVGSLQNRASYIYDADIEAVKRHNTSNGAQDDHPDEEPSTEGDGYEALIVADMEHLRQAERREVYQCDIVFGTNNEFGFDYLRDNMVQNIEDKVQRELNFAIIDEVDSILIDEARTPLIISAPAEDGATQQYYQYAQVVAGLTENEHFNVDEKMKSVALTNEGIAAIEKKLGIENIYASGDLRMVHLIEQSLKARMLFVKDKDYVVKEGEIVIIDEFTGRMMQGRRYSEGLHQAIEAKENVEIKQESRTLATITLQNLFRLYNKLSGMTGTAETESEEFHKIYQLDVTVIPTHREIARQDMADRVYKNTKAKYTAVIQHIKELSEKGQPVLVGTISIEHNEFLSELLTTAGVKHNVLNAKQHESEAEIIAQAGKRGAVTVATNMAGRGVDIMLGGNPVDLDEQRAVKELGGLAVLGTERHESRRIDNQLRGRAGRQGDPGSSQFFVSLDDDLMRIFAGDRVKKLMETMKVPDDMPIENKIVSRSIESAQKKVEGRNFDVRKHLVEYDDVMNKHRDAIYRRRNEVLTMESDALRKHVYEMISGEIEQVVSFHTNKEDEGAGDWDLKEICETMATMFPMEAGKCLSEVEQIHAEEGKLGQAQVRTQLIDAFNARATAEYAAMVEKIGDESVMTQVERQFILRTMDQLWIDHLDQMSFLRDSIGLQGYGQRDPLVEYKRESYGMFQRLLGTIQQQVSYNVFKLRDAKIVQHGHDHDHGHEYTAPEKEMHKQTEKEGESQPVSVKKATDADGKEIGPNDPCYCGSGKKLKKCHGVG